MAIPISRFASVTGDIAKAQGDGKAFSLLPGQCEELERRSGEAEGQRVLTIAAKRQIADGGRVRQSSAAPRFRPQSSTILRPLHNSGTKIRDCSH
ncbi:hypothetical protein GFL88_25805 [Rhizobium leguminosarum bv. viciae]|uniref:hypothetical protein n=1 Tax=Rhizobium leguminosarum TaxID=384 RepID=UPI001441BFA2|nr:hypothetical protein [Rhizobium leguminosarum]NKK66878.1 hypothetical protein [Rhizobium leguminosarum bv. viciae]